MGMTVPSCYFPVTHSTKRGRDQASIRAGLTLPWCDAGLGVVPSEVEEPTRGEARVRQYLKWIGPLGLLAALVIGDQIRINRPGHKYRMTVEADTPTGVKSASGPFPLSA